MQRITKSLLTVLAMLLMLNMVLIAPSYTPSARADNHLDATISHSVELYGDLGLKYNVKLNSSGSYSNMYLRLQRQKFADAGSSYTWETIDLKNYTVENGEYVFRYYGLRSTEMPNLIRATLYAQSGNVSLISETDEMSLRTYFQALLKKYSQSTATKDRALCTLVVDLLNYGAASQKYFHINEQSLANAGLTSAQKALGSKLPSAFSNVYAYTPFSRSICSIDHFEMDNVPSLCLNALLRFTSNPDSSTYLEVSYTSVTGTKKTIKKNFSDFSYNTSTRLYKVSIPEIKAPEFYTKLSLVVKRGSTQISGKYTYSVESYVHQLIASATSGGSEEAWDFITNLMAYASSAKVYFGIGGSGNTTTPTKKATVTPTKTSTPVPTNVSSLSTYKNSKFTKNMPNAVIVIPSAATDEEKYAANMLQLYISREDGYTPSIIIDATSQGSKGFEISVGRTNRPHGTAAYKTEGSYSIKSYTNGISILGVGERGTIDGAAAFLSACGGYFWLSFEDGYITNQTHFKYETNISIDYNRPFIFSDIDVYFGKFASGENRMFTISGGLNGFFANLVTQNQAGSQNWYLYDPETAHYPTGLRPGQAHTLLNEYFYESDLKQHPEWFSKWKGTRQYKQLCLSNPEVKEHILEHVMKILKGSMYDKNAPMQILCLGQDDNEVYCQCSDCYNYNLAHTVPDINGDPCGMFESAHYLELCNYVSKAVKKAGYKNVYIELMAYTWNYRPPKDVAVDDHVIVQFAPISRCYAHRCNDTSCVKNKEVVTFMNEWARLCREGGANFWIWDYNANWFSTIAPYPNFDALMHDIAYYKSVGVTGVYLQSNDRHGDCNTEFGDLRNYLGNVLLKNPNADVDAEIDFFMNQFYGASAPYMKEYMQILCNQAKRHGCGPNCKYNPYLFRDKIMGYDAKPMQTFCNDFGVSYLVINGVEQAVSATEYMDAHNRMTDTDIARCEQLSKLAMSAVSKDTARHQYTTERTLLSWRIVKSCLKVEEFSKSSTYIAENRKLYSDIVNKFGTKVFSLIFRNTPSDSDAIMAKNPGEWPVP